MTTAPMIPSSPSLAVMAGSAPMARSVRSSSAQKPSWRLITWPAMRMAASAAMRPNTPRAMASGLMAFSAFVTSMEAS